MIFEDDIDEIAELMIERKTFSGLLKVVEYQKQLLSKLKFELGKIKISKEARIMLF